MTPTLDSFGQRTASASPPPTAIREQLERILNSETLLSSPRRRVFLRYLVEETLAGHTDALNGYSLALAVFGRDGTFEPQSDPVVRLEARSLRRDLDSYYVDAGARDPVRISIPKGHYVPHFKWHQAPTVPSSPDGTERGAGGGTVDAATGVAPAAEKADGTGMAERGRWGFPILVSLLAVALVAAAGGLWLWLRGPLTSGTEFARGPAVVVLPFETLSPGEDDRFLAAGVTQLLITDLMQFDGFRLYSVPASFRLDADADPLTMGHNLGVDYVVKGSVGSEATTVRVAVQLYNAQTGQVVWSKTYDRAPTPGALLSVQSEFAASIATALGQTYGAVNSNMTDRLSRGVEPSMASYACVLRAYTYRRKFRSELRPSVLACLEAAVERDPGYAEAWALLGFLHLDAARFAIVPDAEVPGEMERALDFASKAVAIDPENQVALRALATVRYHLGNFDESERILRQALALNPNDPDTLATLGWRLAVRGRWDEGLVYSERSVARIIDPPGWYYEPIRMQLYMQGRYRELLASAEHSPAGDPRTDTYLAIAYGALGDRAAAKKALDRMAKQAPAFNRDPAAEWRRFHVLDSMVNALMDGLRKAGWTEPSGSTIPSQK